MAAAGDTLPVVLKDFSFYFPSFDITGSCKPAGGQDLGEMTVGSGTVGGAGASGATTGASPDGSPDAADPTTTSGGGDAPGGGITVDGVQDIAVVDVRLEGSRTIGELFGAAPKRTLVVVVQNVGRRNHREAGRRDGDGSRSGA